MTRTTCAQCGQPLPENAKFCGQCGAVSEAVPASRGARTLMQLQPPPEEGPDGATSQGAAVPAKLALPKGTMMGLAAPVPLPVPTPDAAPGAAAPANATPAQTAPNNKPAPATPLSKQTMMGMSPPAAARQMQTMMGLSPAPPAASAPSLGPASLPLAGHKTMLGLAAPALGGTQALDPPADPPARTGAQPAGLHRTMLGVAMPGIAPTGQPALSPAAPPPAPPPPAPPPPVGRREATLALNVPYVPPPAPLRDVPAPPAPRIGHPSRGVPLALVALAAAALVLVGGVTLALVWKGAPPISAVPHSTADGHDLLSLHCDPKSCADGTVVAVDDAKATFAGGEAELALTHALRVGENVFSLRIDRPGMGRDETLKLVVPVGYRVRADVTTMNAPRPSITIRVEAPPGTDVRIDNKPVALDASGAGAYAVDESTATEGPADESRTLSVDLPYVVVPSGGTAEKGMASARVGIAPLRIDSPAARSIVDEDKVLLAGRAAKGSTVTVAGAPVSVAADGGFETTIALPALGERTIEVRAGTASLMPRTVRTSVVRVASLAEAARQFEQQHPLGYDAAMADVAGKTGQPIVASGKVVEARSSGHRTLLLLDDARGCAHGPCLVRVIVGRDLTLSRGDALSAYGTVSRTFTPPAGQTVLEIEAQFVLRAGK